MKKLISLSGLLLCLSCGPQQNSSVDGHYESSNEQLMSKYDGAQAAIAEYEDSVAVVIALPLLTSFQKEDLAAKILDTGVLLLVTVPSNYYGTTDSPEFSRLRSMVGSKISNVRLIRQKTSGTVSVWARDWAPIGAKSNDGALALLDFNYYSNRPADDVTPQSMGDLYSIPRVSVPVYNEGGNFMNNNRGECLMTSRVTEANRYREVSGDMILNSGEIKDYYERFAGCSYVHIFPRMPYEGTGHIDMWAKFLNDDVVMVNELREENLANYRSQSDLNMAREVQSYLQSRTRELESMGYRVLKVPMPAPEFGYNSTFRSYTNSLLLNGRAIVPRYTNSYNNGSYSDQSLIPSMEQEVLSAYRSLGFETSFIESDELIAYAGAVHCTTMQIPR